MKTIKSIIFLVSVMVFCVNADAQGVRIYKKDGLVTMMSYSELDSIVASASEDANRVYRSDGTMFRIFYSDVDSIVGVAGNITDPDFVDLGLSIRWASHNIGAQKPEDYGCYFSWGEIVPKTSYTKENCATRDVKMSGISGNAEYDAASANWGMVTRIPTYEECCELRDKCSWKWTILNGTGGQLVTGPNGNSIFIPAAGVCRGDSLFSDGYNGYFWSATPYEDDDASAYYNLFNSSGFWGSMRSRNDGLSIRPVSGNIQCVCYTGDTLKVGESEAEVSVMFAYVPSVGIKGGVEYYSTTTGNRQRQTIDVNKDGEYIVKLDALERGAKYKYRSFVVVDEKYVYGKTEEFITKNYEDNLTKGEWIDMGLSVKWSSHNVGAVNPEDCGSYYAWGEIYPKQSYDESNSTTSGVEMTDISGNSEYDAARASWGGNARIPTEDEIKELIEKCTWTWTSRNGINGMLVTGPNGNTIFMPASGFRIGPALDYEEGNGFYWSSTPDETDYARAYGLSFNKGGSRSNRNSRFNGRNVRPVSD